MPNETKGAGQNTSSGASEQSSGNKGGTTSKDKGKLYTDAQIHQIKTAAGADAGRLRKAAEQERDALKQDLESTRSRLDALEKEANESRLAEARGDPEALRIYQREQALVKREREVEERDRDVTRREGLLKSDRETLDKDRGVVTIAYVAAKHGLETEELESLGISDPDTLERVAEKLAAGKAKEPGEGEGEGGEGGEGEGGEGETFVPDSGEGTGGAGTPTLEQREKMPMRDYAKLVAKEKGEK